MCQSRWPWTLVLAMAIAGAGCVRTTAVSPEVLRGWVGRPAAALEQDWGAPTREVRNGALRVLVYEQLDRRNKLQTPGPDTPQRGTGQLMHDQAQAAANPSTFYARSYRFWVDATGTILRVETVEP